MPTYNELEVLEGTVESLFESVPEIHLAIIDDNSPDGTGALADRLALKNKRISVIHRPQKRGLGLAYVEGFEWAVAHGFSHVVQMDSDGSHRPSDLPALLQEANSHDLVIGSRWVSGGEVKNWPAIRMLISRLGNRYAALMLGSGLKDLTAGYRIYSAKLLGSLPLSEMQAHGYGFQVEMTLRSSQAGAKIIEVPIHFVERESGKSKMTLGIVLEAFWLCTRWGIARLFRR
jgi:glycosyltransferase involved in cell wall biosynthesis